MTLHATLSPSAAERWLRCPASIRMAEAVPEQPESMYAREGTAAHALAYMLARELLLGTPGDRGPWREEFNIDPDAEAEMEEYAMQYVDFLRLRLEANPGSQLLLEQQLPTGIPDCWGTSDAVIVSPEAVESVDFKYGLGVRVFAEGNPQLRLYGVGALEAYGDLLGDVEVVRLHIFQPRLGHTSSEEISAADLRAWRDSIRPVAEAALGPDAPFGPGEDTCRWCPVSGRCRAQMEYSTRLDFGRPAELLDDTEIAEALRLIPGIEAWCSAVKAYALDYVYSGGHSLPGFKVVMSGGRRSIADPEAALEALTAIGYALDEVSVRKVKGIGELEKLLKGDFDVAVEPFIVKGEGSPSLVPEDDRRPTVNPEERAAEDFR